MKQGDGGPAFHVKQVRADASELGIRMTGEQVDRLTAFEALLRERAVPMGMIAASDSHRLYERHLLDSLRATTAFEASDALAYDLGSGAGLPGIPLAIALPHVRIVLCEARRRRGAFLELAVESLALENAEVVVGRAQDLTPGANVATARAFAPLAQTWPLARPLLSSGGRLVYFAGAGMSDPRAGAEALTGEGETVRLLRPLASSTPLVIMSRR